MDKKIIYNPFDDLFNQLTELRESVEELKELQRGLIDELLTPKEAAAFIKIDIKTLRKWTKENIIPSHQIGATTRYKKSELLGSNTKQVPNLSAP